MFQRSAAATLAKLARGFPVVVLTGPRQSGKTTLARQAFAHLPYVSLEDPDTRRLALNDARRFLTRLPDGAILDEVQRVPELLSYLQTRVDADRRKGAWVLTGSQQFGLMDGITQSLAGRAGLLHLLPLSNAEILHSAGGSAQARSLEQRLWRGAYPALQAVDGSAPDPAHWFGAYVSTYIERDVRQMLNVGNLLLFQRFVQLCATRSGQLLNLNALAADCGVSQPTARQWLTVLQASYLVALLPPYHRNFGKRLVKSPKLYFLDTGLLCHLLRITEPQQLRHHAMRGPVFETWVVSEVLKHRFHQGLNADLHFWRDNHGLEVDLLFEHDGVLHPVEVKSGGSFSPDWAVAASRWRLLAQAARPTVVYGGGDSFETDAARVMAWHGLGR